MGPQGLWLGVGGLYCPSRLGGGNGAQKFSKWLCVRNCCGPDLLCLCLWSWPTWLGALYPVDTGRPGCHRPTLVPGYVGNCDPVFPGQHLVPAFLVTPRKATFPMLPACPEASSVIYRAKVLSLGQLPLRQFSGGTSGLPVPTWVAIWGLREGVGLGRGMNSRPGSKPKD